MTHDVATRITHETVQAWLDAYERAWETYDPQRDRRALQRATPNTAGTPPTSPWSAATTIVGPGSRRSGNASGRDEPARTSASTARSPSTGSRAVAIGDEHVLDRRVALEVERIYYNNWLLEFDDDGRCSSFTEYWMAPRKT